MKRYKLTKQSKKYVSLLNGRVRDAELLDILIGAKKSISHKKLRLDLEEEEIQKFLDNKLIKKIKKK